MGYDAQRKIFLPDFQAPEVSQEWVPMGDDAKAISQSVGAVGNSFKQRLMNADPVDLGGGSSYTPGGSGAVRPRVVGDSLKAAAPVGAEGKSGGAMKSLG